MKLKPKGRKIYRYKTRFEHVKGFFRNTGAVILTIAGIAAVGFIGYSVGAPVMEFLEERNIVTAPTEPASLPPEEDTSGYAAESGTEEVSASSSQEDVILEMHGYRLCTDALTTQQALAEALQTIPDGITHIIVPLKTEGGRLHYATSLEDAGMCGAVISALMLETIYSAISDAGYVPAASVNALEDSIYPKTYADAGYQIAGTQERWLDNTPENNGKPWLSPFSSLAVDYLSNLAQEIADAGFSVILCEGLTFPDFSEEDLSMLDPRAGAADRGSALADVVNAMQSAAGEAQFLVCVEGEALLNGNAEIFSSGKSIAPDGIVVSADADTADRAEALSQMTNGLPCILQMEEIVDTDGNYIVYPGMSDASMPADNAGES